NGGGAAAGGSSAQDAGVAVTPGLDYLMVGGQRGINGGNGTPSSFSGDSVTRTAPAGLGTTTSTGASAPSAGFGGFAGGPRGDGTASAPGGRGGRGGADRPPRARGARRTPPPRRRG